jgi:alkylation response protein AidB-like acyl-CoA dehydrogenase
MRFELTGDQTDFAASLDAFLTSANTTSAARSWGAGDHTAGLALWKKLVDLGVPALLVPEADDGIGATPVEHVTAMEALGRHAVPGPWIESAAFLATGPDAAVRKAVASGTVATVAAPPATPFALDADVAELVLHASDSGLNTAEVGSQVTSIDPVRRLFNVTTRGSGTSSNLGTAHDTATLAASAQLLGAGERMLDEAVTYVKQRTQFGRTIGSFQAIKHALADVRIALDFARPLVYAAALHPVALSDERSRDVSAAKIAAGDAAYLAARTALQVHGAIGYTQEHDLSLWLLHVRGLISTWGTPAWHRARVLALVSR